MKVELVTSLKRQATKILADLHDTKEPVLITEHGKPSAYLIDVDDYEFYAKSFSNPRRELLVVVEWFCLNSHFFTNEHFQLRQGM